MAISRIETNSIAPSQTLTTPIIATTMGVGGATPSGSGSGITFPATQSASTDANTLDDYEEGTWTPIDASGAGLSFTVTGAYYTKIGRLVIAQGEITFPTTASGATAAIGGLPFTSLNISGYRSSIGSGYNNKNLTMAIYSSYSSSNFNFFVTSGTACTNVQLTGGLLAFTVVYMTN